jgi:thiamine-phosphate pyrophosphorylase
LAVRRPALLQLRAKDLTDARLVALARAAVGAARESGVPLIVNDRPDIARVVGADGVHLGQDDLPPDAARAVLGPDAIIGFSTHDLDQVRAAAAHPIDYLALGPVFRTGSKANPDPVVGPALLARARAHTSLPLVAIGGITRANVGEVVAAGADGVAVIGDLFRSSDWAGAAQGFETALRSAVVKESR